jgi:hypothetical protein
MNQNNLTFHLTLAQALFLVSRMDTFGKCRALSAFQVLSLPSGTLGATHKSAKAALVEAFGKAPTKTVPGGLSLDEYLAWFTGDSAQ